MSTRNASDICRHKINYLQQIIQSMCVVFDHGFDNLIVIPKLDKETFGQELVIENKR